MRVTKSVTVKVSPRTNKTKMELLKQFYEKCQEVAQLYASYILENNLHKALIYDITSTELKKSLHQKLYNRIREKYDIGSQTVQEIRDVVVEAFNSWAKLYKKWFEGKIDNEPSVPKIEHYTIRMNVPRVCSIFEHGKEFPFFFKVKVNSRRVAFPVECGEYQCRLIKEALSGRYKLGAVQLVMRNGWFYFVVTVKKEVELNRSENVVGVDVGLRYQAVLVVMLEDGTITDVEFVKYRELLDKIRHYWKKIDSLKSMLPEGQKTSKQIKRFWGKIRRINDWIAHNVSKRIVEKAKEYNAMIAIEDLSNFRPKKGEKSRKLNRQLSNWIHGRINEYVLYKAHWEGIYVKVVPPNKTSRKCHVCGAEGFRRGATFKCSAHPYTINADFNAACNIAARAKSPRSWGRVNRPVGQAHKAPSVRAG